MAVTGLLAAQFMFAPWFGELTALVVILLTYWLGSSRATREPWFRESGVNLEATRGEGEPRIWLVAHIDSKSQPIPSGIRTLGALMMSVAFLLQFAVRWPADLYVYWIGIAGGLLLMAASVGARSDGAADNASGVAAVLEAASLVTEEKRFGVLITDAEELALAGAMAWVRGRPKGMALNCDTIDDLGRFTVFQYGSLSHDLDDAMARAVREADPDPRFSRPPPGILTDSDAFRAAGWKTLTLARGTIRTLNRIHTRRDSLDHLRGTGIPDAARALARIVEELS